MTDTWHDHAPGCPVSRDADASCECGEDDDGKGRPMFTAQNYIDVLTNEQLRLLRKVAEGRTTAPETAISDEAAANALDGLLWPTLPKHVRAEADAAFERLKTASGETDEQWAMRLGAEMARAGESEYAATSVADMDQIAALVDWGTKLHGSENIVARVAGAQEDQFDDIKRFVDLMKRGVQDVAIAVRKDGEEYRFSGHWLGGLFYGVERQSAELATPAPVEGDGESVEDLKVDLHRVRLRLGEAGKRVVELLEEQGEWDRKCQSLSAELTRLKATISELTEENERLRAEVDEVRALAQYSIAEPKAGWAKLADISAEERLYLRPIAETLAMLDGNAFFGMMTDDNGDDTFFEQYLPEAKATFDANGGLNGWSGEASFARQHREPADPTFPARALKDHR